MSEDTIFTQERIYTQGCISKMKNKGKASSYPHAKKDSEEEGNEFAIRFSFFKSKAEIQKVLY